MASGVSGATPSAGALARRTIFWTLGVAVLLYLSLGGVIAAQGQPQQLWACPDDSSPSGEVLYAQPPTRGCEPTVSRHDRAKSFAILTVLGPAWVMTKTIYGDD